MVGEIISVGTELLLGDILNTNARYLSLKLAELGIDLYYQTVVGDNEERLSEAIIQAGKRSDIIILTGGLGPTGDDITKETLAKALGKKLILDKVSENNINDYFTSRGISPGKTNIKQAYIPEDAIALKNDNGTAPGIFLKDNDKLYFCLPGPPNEMKPMFEEQIMPIIQSMSSTSIYSRTIKLIGIGESKAAEIVQHIIDSQINPTIAPYAKTSEVHFRITVKSDNREMATELLDKTEKELRIYLDEYIYSNDEQELNEVIVKLLLDKELTISSAESCTGGLFSSSIISVPGASKVFAQGIVAYSYESKNKLLGIRPDVLQSQGAVSEIVVKEMARNIRMISDTDIGISISGIAGPGGATENKPIGLIWMAVDYKDHIYTEKIMLKGSRNKIRENTTKQALSFLYRILTKKQ